MAVDIYPWMPLVTAMNNDFGQLKVYVQMHKNGFTQSKMKGVSKTYQENQVANPEAKTLFLYPPGICHWLNSYFVHLVLHARLVRAAFPDSIGLHLKQRKQARILNPCETNSHDQWTALFVTAHISCYFMSL